MFSRNRRAFQDAVRSACRWASSLPQPAIDGRPGAEFLSISQTVPPLFKLSTRKWGAPHVIHSDDVSRVAGHKPATIAVVRQAFAPFDHTPHELSDTVRLIKPNQVAVNAAVAEPHERMLIDEYIQAASGDYVLKKVGTDMLRWLRRHHVWVCYVPDVHTVSSYNTLNAAQRSVKQSTNEVLMVAPTAFTFNEQAAQDNTFMHSKAENAADNVTRRVLKEFAGLHHQLTEVAGVHVNLFEHGPHHGTPDAVFPNNWFSTHAAGEGLGVDASTLVIYPMKCPNRQAERREDILSVLHSRGYHRVLDMTGHEKGGKYFEGTGVLVLDRINGVVYVALSERADQAVAEHWAQELGYNDLVTFTSTDSHGTPVYHTNVMMAIGTDLAVVCAESVADDKERARLMEMLRKRHAVVDITRHQMAALCGNVLELEDGRGLPVLAMSTQAYNAFTPDQRKLMKKHVADLVHAPIDTLEYIGGGGVRCTLAELF